MVSTAWESASPMSDQPMSTSQQLSSPQVTAVMSPVTIARRMKS
ncbi:hypothetical protein WM015_01570 [Bifidobacterium mongoliense]